MEKIAIGPGFEEGIIGLDRTPRDNIEALAKAKGVKPHEITVCILDRSRHRKLIEDVRAVGAAIRLIGDGDIAGVIQTTDPEETGLDMYLGIGGADQGILAAAALSCAGGQIEGRLHLRDKEDQKLASKYEIEDVAKIYSMSDMIAGDVDVCRDWRDRWLFAGRCAPLWRAIQYSKYRHARHNRQRARH